jgi:hypothetical protein
VSLTDRVTLPNPATGLSATASVSYTVGPSAALPVVGVPNPVTNSGPTSWTAISAALGTVLAERYYFTPAQNVPSASPALPPGVTKLIASFRPTVASVLSGSLDAQLAALFATVRPGDMWTAWHEGEAHVDTPADFIAMASHIYPIFKANAPASALFGEIHMSYTATAFSQFRPLSKWLSCPANGGTQLDFIGIDCYPVNNSDSWADLINPVVSEVESVISDPVWGICECNNNAATMGTDAQVTETFSDGWAWAKANGALTFVPYFGNAPCIWPPSPAVISALAGINAASKA